MSIIMLLLASIGGWSSPTAERALVLTIENMSCTTCAVPISEALTKAEGVLKVEFDAELKRVTVTYEPRITDSRRLVSRAAQAGYRAIRVADAAVVDVSLERPESCVIGRAPSRRHPSRGVIHGRLERVDRGCLTRSR